MKAHHRGKTFPDRALALGEAVRRPFRSVPVRRPVGERDRHAHRLRRPREDVERAVDEGRGLVVVEDDRRTRESRVQESLFGRGPKRALVEGRVEPPPDPLEDLPEGAQGRGRGRHSARERRVEVRVRDDEPGHDEAARGVEPAPRLDSQEHVAPLDGGRVERDDGAAGDGEAARARSVPARRLHHPRASRSRRSTSSGERRLVAPPALGALRVELLHGLALLLDPREVLQVVPALAALASPFGDPVELLPAEDGREKRLGPLARERPRARLRGA